MRHKKRFRVFFFATVIVDSFGPGLFTHSFFSSNKQIRTQIIGDEGFSDKRCLGFYEKRTRRVTISIGLVYSRGAAIESLDFQLVS